MVCTCGVAKLTCVRTSVHELAGETTNSEQMLYAECPHASLPTDSCCNAARFCDADCSAGSAHSGAQRTALTQEHRGVEDMRKCWKMPMTLKSARVGNLQG
jgi:hypothetical protein